MSAHWQEKVVVYEGADAGAATLGSLTDTPDGIDQLRINTDVVWANKPLGVFANNDVIQSVIGPQGGLYRMVSDATLALWGGYSDQDALVSLSRADIAGEPDAHVIQLAATSNNWIYDGSVFIDANAASTGAAGTYGAQVNVAANNATITTQVLNRASTAEGAWIDIVGFGAQTNGFNFRISDEGGPVTEFMPFVGGPGTVSYNFDTSQVLTEDDAQLFTIKNNGVRFVSISRDGGFLVGQNTQAWVGGLAIDGLFFAGFSDPSLGDQDHFGLQVGAGDSTAVGDLVYFKAQGEATFGEVLLECITGGVLSAGISMQAGTSGAFQSISISGTARFQANPSVTDGAGSIAYLFDTGVSLANNDARLLSLKNNGVEHLRVSKVGGIMVGPNAPAAWGSLPVNGDCFIAISNKALGDPTYMRMELATLNGAASGNVEIMAFEGDATVIVTKNAAPQTQWKICAQDTTNLLSIAGVVASTNRMLFMPQVADGAGAVAYFCDTSVNLTNAAARIFEWRNAGSVKAAITKDGFFTVSGTKVVGTRVVDARIDDTPNSGDATTDGIIDAIQDTLIAHGLAAAA